MGISKISCMSSGEEDNLDSILEGVVSNELVAMAELWGGSPCQGRSLSLADALMTLATPMHY